METLEESYIHKLDPKVLTQLITARGESDLIRPRVEYFQKYTKDKYKNVTQKQRRKRVVTALKGLVKELPLSSIVCNS